MEDQLRQINLYKWQTLGRLRDAPHKVIKSPSVHHSRPVARPVVARIAIISMCCLVL